MTKFIIVRHGYSVANKEKRFSGQMDIPLDEVGLCQAQSVADYIVENFKVDSIYTSDLIRTVQTVKPTAERLGLEFLSLDAFRVAFMGINYGFIPNFIVYVAEKFSLEKISALTLLHNVHSRPGNLHNSDIKKETIEYASMVWSIFDKYKLDKKQWIPYFENNEIKVLEEKAYASIYKDKRETVAIVSSFVNKEITIVAKGYKKAVNIVKNIEYGINDDKVIVDVKPNSPTFFILK